MMKSITKLTTMVEKLETKFSKLGATAKTDRKKEDAWTCLHCRCETCFASRAECYKCGKPRVPKPPGLGGQPPVAQPGSQGEATQATPMEVEVKEVLEDLISEQEEILKFFKGKETSFARAARLAAESRLKELKEKQRQARALPARLQAATHRYAKAQQLFEEQEVKVAAVEESLMTARRELEEAGDKRRGALQELEEVKQQRERNLLWKPKRASRAAWRQLWLPGISGVQMRRP